MDGDIIQQSFGHRIITIDIIDIPWARITRVKSVQYDDGRSAITKWWSESDSLTIVGNPGDVNVEILYEVTFSGNIDYKYIIDVVCPEGIDATVSVKDKVGNAVTYGSWEAPASEPTGPFEMKFDVSISIKSILS